MWNEEPYSANLISVIFVFTFVYSIILYAFSKVIEGNVLVFIVRHGTLVAEHPHVAPFYTRIYRLSTSGCKGWQHGGVYGIMYLSLLKKEIAFVE